MESENRHKISQQDLKNIEVNYKINPEELEEKEDLGSFEYNGIEIDLNTTQPEERPIKHLKFPKLKGIKEDKGKTVYSELDWDYIDAMAERMSTNRNKYPPKNWQKKMDIVKLAESAMRHARKIIQSMENDEETLEQHATALGCNGMMIAYQLKNNKK